MMQLADLEALPAAVAGDAVRARETTGMQLLLVLAVRADRGHVQSRVQPLGAQIRRARGGGGDDELAFTHDRLDALRHLHLHPQLAAHFVGVTRDRLRVASMHEYAPEPPHEPQGTQLEAGLHAGADYARSIDGPRRQVARRDRSSEPGAQVREVAVVQQHGLEETGARAHYEHQPTAVGQPARWIVEESGSDLDRETVVALYVCRLDVDLAAVGGDVHPYDRWHADAALRQPGKTERHGLGCFIRHRHATTDLAFVQHQYAHGRAVGSHYAETDEAFRHVRCRLRRGDELHLERAASL